MPSVPLVVITDTDFGATDIEEEVLREAGFEVRVASCRTEEDLLREGRGAAGFLLQFAPASRRVIEGLADLRAIVRLGTGLDTIDLAAAADRGVEVQGIAGYCTDEVADHAMALVLAATRGVVTANRSVTDGGWPAAEAVGPLATLRGRRLGLVGFGRIGRAVAERAAAFGMEVGAYDTAYSPKELEAMGVRPLDLKEAFGCEVVSLHLPLTPETSRLVDRSLLSELPERAVLVNVSRGGLVNEDDLLASLDDGRPWMACLDVLGTEPPAGDHPLVQHPNVIVTPHLGFYSTDSIRTLRRMAAERLVSILAP